MRSPFTPGATDIDEDVWRDLEPLDGFPKGSRSGPRIYRYDAGGRHWWVVISTSDFGDIGVGQSGPMAIEGEV